VSRQVLGKLANIQSCPDLIFSNQQQLKLLALLTALPLTFSMPLAVALLIPAVTNVKAFSLSLSPYNVSTRLFYTTVFLR